MTGSNEKKHKSKKLFSHKGQFGEIYDVNLEDENTTKGKHLVCLEDENTTKGKHLKKRIKETKEFCPYDQSSFIEGTPQDETQNNDSIIRKKKKKKKKETPQKQHTQKYDKASFVEETPQVETKNIDSIIRKKRKKEKKGTSKKTHSQKYDMSTVIDISSSEDITQIPGESNDDTIKNIDSFSPDQTIELKDINIKKEKRETPDKHYKKKKRKKEKTPEKHHKKKCDLSTMIDLTTSEDVICLDLSNDESEKTVLTYGTNNHETVTNDVPVKRLRKQEKVMNRTKKHLKYDAVSPVSGEHPFDFDGTEKNHSSNSIIIKTEKTRDEHCKKKPGQVCNLSKLDNIYGTNDFKKLDRHNLPPKNALLYNWDVSLKYLDEKGVSYASGKWTEIEMSILNENIKTFVDSNGISDFTDYYNDPKENRPSNMYVELGRDIYRDIRRIKVKVESLYDKVYLDAIKTDTYTKEEIMHLFKLHKMYGSSWKLIAKEMQRKPSSVKTRFLNSKMFYKDDELLIPPNPNYFTIEEDQKLVELVNQISNDYPDNIHWCHVSKLMGTRTEYSISAVLTIDSIELNQLLCGRHTNTDKKWNSFSAKFVCALDEPNFNILSCLQECVEFIEKFVENGENVLVHCLAGQSRSVSLVTAFLMKNKHISLEDALEFVQHIKPDALPNRGFLNQLKLYEIMNYQIIPSHPMYRCFVANIQQNQLLGSSHVWSPLDYNLDGLIVVPQNSLLVYRCQKCRCKLMHSNDLLQVHQTDCTSFYLVDPPDWLKTEMGSNIKGKIACWKCSTKLGVYCWAGNKCSCGKWVTPAFQIHKSKVDYQTAIN